MNEEMLAALRGVSNVLNEIAPKIDSDNAVRLKACAAIIDMAVGDL